MLELSRTKSENKTTLTFNSNVERVLRGRSMFRRSWWCSVDSTGGGAEDTESPSRSTPPPKTQPQPLDSRSYVTSILMSSYSMRLRSASIPTRSFTELTMVRPTSSRDVSLFTIPVYTKEDMVTRRNVMMNVCLILAMLMSSAQFSQSTPFSRLT